MPNIGSTSDLTGSFLSPATNVVITNLSLPLANNEYSHYLQSDLKILQFKLRGKSDLNFCFASGESNTKYITLPKDCTYEIFGLDFTGKTLYIQTPIAGQILEIIEYY